MRSAEPINAVERPGHHTIRALRACALAVLVHASPAQAQDSARASRPEGGVVRVSPVRVTATRDGSRSSLEVPYAVTVARADSLAALRRAGVDELLFAVPGVSVANRQNPAQDPRVSIRGFGARSAFGVRGVRVLQDGVPVTLPDGQTPVDVLDLEGAARVEVIRGSASSLYGNAAGGVLDVRTASPVLVPLAPAVRVVGGDGTPTVTAVSVAGTIPAGTLGGAGYTSSLTRTVGRGYRDYSDQRATRAAVRFSFAPGGAASMAVAARLSDVSLAESPGALTRAQLDSAPTMADPLSVRKLAGKIVRQGDLSAAWSRASGASTLDATMYGSARLLKNPLTFATVDVERTSGGASLRGTHAATIADHAVRITGGADVQWQHDDRHEYENCAGITVFTRSCPDAAQRGAPRKSQRELVTSAGPFVRAEVALLPGLLASAGARADAVRFQLVDFLVTSTNPDDSGDRTLHAISPSAGVVWRVSPVASVYASVSSSFETPTTTELGNKPDGSAGINPDLQPQRTLALELGSKGLLAGDGPLVLRWDAALFEARATDELVPFDIAGGGGRRYFRNAGRTLRRGAEIGADASAGAFEGRVAYTIARFRYVDYTVGPLSYEGMRIPGVPVHSLATAASVGRGAVRLSVTADLASPTDVDDANSAQSPGRAILGAAIAGTIRIGGVRFAPTVAVQNLSNTAYAGSVSVNAAGGKFYEPASRRTLLLRVALARDSAARQ